jgi:hypothetical protein
MPSSRATVRWSEMLGKVVAVDDALIGDSIREQE